jgi:hypothetical protein
MIEVVSLVLIIVVWGLEEGNGESWLSRYKVSVMLGKEVLEIPYTYIVQCMWLTMCLCTSEG